MKYTNQPVVTLYTKINMAAIKLLHAASRNLVSIKYMPVAHADIRIQFRDSERYEYVESPSELLPVRFE